MIRARLLKYCRPFLDRHSSVKAAAYQLETGAALLKHTAAAAMPFIILPDPRRITIAVTAACNYQCTGCRYGRDFMVGHYLTVDLVRTLLDDAADAGMTTVRLYGGEPLVHPGLPEMIRHARQRGLLPYITTNGWLLGRKIGELRAAGLGSATLGYYGFGPAYDEYTGTPGAFDCFRKSIETVRQRCGNEFKLQLNFLLMRPTCTLDALHRAWDLASTYGMSMQFDLLHYSLPYFTEGPDRILQFTGSDEAAIRNFTNELLRLKREQPARIPEPETSLRSIPDWLLKGPSMRIPCDAYNMIWVGADGSVQLCYAAFPLGNLHQTRLRAILHGAAHRAAARGSFELDCPNCHCERSTRIAKHLPSQLRYGAAGQWVGQGA